MDALEGQTRVLDLNSCASFAFILYTNANFNLSFSRNTARSYVDRHDRTRHYPARKMAKRKTASVAPRKQTAKTSAACVFKAPAAPKSTRFKSSRLRKRNGES